MCGHIVACLDRDTVTHWLRNLEWSLMNLGSRSGANDSSSVVGSVDWVDRLSLSLSPAQVMGGGSDHSLGRPMMTMDSWSVLHCDWLRGGDIGGHHLAVMTNHVSGVNGLGADLLAGGGDHLLAVLSDGGVHNLVILLMAHLPWCLNLPTTINDQSYHQQ